MNEMLPDKSLKSIPLLPCRAMLREPFIWQKTVKSKTKKAKKSFPDRLVLALESWIYS